MNKNNLDSVIDFFFLKNIIIVLLLIAFNCNISSQKIVTQLKKANTTVKKQNPQVSYSIVPFDLNITKIPIYFKGVNPIELYNRLEKKTIGINKGEFETTAQYEERLLIENLNPILGNLNELSLIALKPSKTKLYILDFKYDADKQLLDLTLELDDYRNDEERSRVYDLGDRNKLDIRNRNRKLVVLVEKITSDKSYLASNAFGASTTVYYWESTNYALYFQNWSNFTNAGLNESLINFEIKVDPIIAKKIKENDLNYGKERILGTLYIGKLSKPYSLIGEYFSNKATLDSPDEFKKHYKCINMNVQEIWIYNTNTGEIYTKIKPQKNQDLLNNDLPIGSTVHKSNMRCKELCVVNGRNLLSFTNSTSYITNDNEEGIITIKLYVDMDGNTTAEISSPTTVKNEQQISKALNIARRLKFTKSNSFSNNGYISFTFEKK
ncbi:MAG: hypothetical protein Q7U47_00215 [Paludibacter sp.]|nr:hypothetical protein [Paludibacter sp.]